MNALPFAHATRATLALAALSALGACTSLAPNDKFDAPTSAAYLETPPGWMTAAPADTLSRGPWWTLFNDPVLNQLAPQVAVSNQNVAAAAAAVEESWAAVREQQASFFPTVSLSAGVTRSGVGGKSGAGVATTSGGTSVVTSSKTTNRTTRYSLGLGASWEPDLWGSVANSVSSAKATLPHRSGSQLAPRPSE